MAYDENIEIQTALRAVELLKQYAASKNDKEKDDILKQLQDVDYGTYVLITKYNYESADLAAKIEKAINLNEYRPRNIPFSKLATRDDLDYINGEFDTFDPQLSKMYRNNEEPETIRERFKVGTANVYILAKQFSADWIRRLKNHPDLVYAAMNADENNAIDAYSKLFDALTKDFCAEYDCEIESKVITDWATSDVKPKGGYDFTYGIQDTRTAHKLVVPGDMSKEERQKLVEKFKKDPKKYATPYQISLVRVNIATIRKNSSDPHDFFYGMICVFAHEMHHALDRLKPRQGALGPQIEIIDRQTYVRPTQDEKAYHDSATEKSSYTIQNELYEQLKKTRF